MTLFQNEYHHRKVAETASKPCELCYKPSASVLVTPDQKDFFYACPGHLKEKAFATPIIDAAAVAAKEKAKKEAELERVKQEVIEQKKRATETKTKDEKTKEKKADADEEKSDKKMSEKDAKVLESTTATTEEAPRIFALHQSFYQQRLDKKRNAEKAKRDWERLQKPNLFPQVPKGPV